MRDSLALFGAVFMFGISRNCPAAYDPGSKLAIQGFWTNSIPASAMGQGNPLVCTITNNIAFNNGEREFEVDAPCPTSSFTGIKFELHITLKNISPSGYQVWIFPWTGSSGGPPIFAGPATGFYSTYVIDCITNNCAYIDASGFVRARVLIRAVGFTASPAPKTIIDDFYWEIL